MPTLPTTIADLSTTAALNYPAGTDSPSTLDDVQRTHASYIAKLRDLNGLVSGTYVAATAITNMGLTPAALGAAASGSNSDITALTALATVPTVVSAAILAGSSAQIQPIGATVAASAMTITASALSLEFRSTTLSSGTVTKVTGTPASLVIPSGATIGTVSAQQSRIAILALNNAGSIELAAINVVGGNDLSESGLISTTAISGASSAANVIYSTTARTGVAYRVIGFVESTQASAGTWATAPSTVQGAGVLSMLSVALGQSWKTVATFVVGTTYYNTSGKKKTVVQWGAANAGSQYWICTVNGVGILSGSATPTANASFFSTTIEIPPGASFVFTANGGTPSSYQSWELS
jgi:hypothetical protein